MNDPFDRNELFGAWVSMGQLDEDWFVAYLATTAKRLLEQMHKSVENANEVTLIFKLNKTDDKEINECTGAWRCYGRGKHEQQTSSESSIEED